MLSTVTLSEFPGSVPMICVWEELYIIGEKQNKTGGSDKTVFFLFFLHLFKAILKHQASEKKTFSCLPAHCPRWWAILAKID